MRVGLSIGANAPLEEQPETEGGWMVGARLELDFVQNIRLWSSLHYLQNRFDAREMDPALGVPVIAAPSDQYRFVKAQIDQRSLQWAAGLKYVFAPERAWRPYLEAGVGAVKILPHEIDYDFRHVTADLETTSQGNVGAQRLLGGIVLLGGGVQYGVSDHWTWQLSMNYRTRWKNRSLFTTRLLGLNTGLHYRF